MPIDYKSHKAKVIKMKPRTTAKKEKKKSSPKPAKARSTEVRERIIAPKNTSGSQSQKQTLNQNILEITMTKQNKAFDQFSKDASDITREYSDAIMKSGTIFMKGYESMMSALMSMVQNSAEKQARLLKEAMSSKTINEFAEVQNKIAQANFDDFMSNATKISELSVKVITESSEPVNSQVTKAIQKATDALAA